MLGELFWLVKSAWGITEGLLNGKSVVVVDVEGEVAGLAVERWVASHTQALGVVEHDRRVAMRDSGVEPGKSVTGEYHLVALTGLSAA